MWKTPPDRPTRYGDDVRVVEIGHHGRLAFEALDRCGGDPHLGEQHLEGHLPPEGNLQRLEDCRHSAAAKLSLNLVLARENQTETRQQRLGIFGRQNDGSRFRVGRLRAAVSAEPQPERDFLAAPRADHSRSRYGRTRRD